MYIEKSLKEALEDYILGRPVTVLWTGNDGGMNAMRLSDLLEQEENHYLVNVPAVTNQNLNRRYGRWKNLLSQNRKRSSRQCMKRRKVLPPPREAGGKDGRRNDRSSGGQYRR